MSSQKFENIYRELHSELLAGVYGVGEVFPSLSVLSTRFATSRPTICKALKLLEEKKLIKGQHGVGTVVLEPMQEARNQQAHLEIAIDFSSEGFSSTYDYFANILKGITRATEKYNFALRLLQPKDIKNWSSMLNRPDGLILSPFYRDELEQELKEVTSVSKVPIALLNRTTENYDVSEICVDYRQESRKAISKFIKEGYTRIGIYGRLNYHAMQLRVDGWRDAYIENGLASPEELIWEAIFDNFTETLDKILATEIPQMFFCLNGSCFHKLYFELLKRNIPNLDQIKFVCFDDVSRLVNEFNINASYIKMPLEEMGFLAAENIYMQLVKSEETHVLKMYPKAILI